VIRTLHYIGEGNWLAWFQGELLSLDLPNSPYGVDEASLTEQTDFRVDSDPVVTWWVLVRNARGQVGWTDKSEAFGNKDACG
jgi:hypothetical protein